MPYNELTWTGRKLKMAQRAARNFSDTNAQPFLLEGGSHGILLLHGFTGSAGHMRPIGEELNRQGYTVLAIQLPGHGTRLNDMQNVGWQDWLQSAKEGILTLKKRCEKVSAAGLSMGGVLTLLLAQQTRINAAIVMSTPMALKNRLAYLAPVASRFTPVTYWRGDEERDKLLDQRYDYGYPGFPTARIGDLLHLIRLARRNLFAVTCPTLVVQSRADETIQPNSADIILKNIRSEKKAVLWLDDVPHVVTISREYQRIAKAMGEFLQSAQAAQPPEGEKFVKTVDKGAEI
jgi:carboxylesterase